MQPIPFPVHSIPFHSIVVRVVVLTITCGCPCTLQLANVDVLSRHGLIMFCAIDDPAKWEKYDSDDPNPMTLSAFTPAGWQGQAHSEMARWWLNNDALMISSAGNQPLESSALVRYAVHFRNVLLNIRIHNQNIIRDKSKRLVRSWYNIQRL